MTSISKVSGSQSSQSISQLIRILIVDRNCMGSQLLAESLERDSRFTAVGMVATTTTTELLSAISARKPQVAVISSEFEGGPRRGLQFVRAINTNHRNVHIVSLLERSAQDEVIAAFRCGAKGVFCRNNPLAEFRSCIERVSRGEIWASGVETEYLLEALRSAPSCDGIDSDKVRMLSKREIQVAECAVQGYSNKQIAEQFQLSEHTVKNYLSRIFDKLGVSTRFELLFLMLKEGNGLASPGAAPNVSGLGNPMETYAKAAEEGYAAAQFVVGLAHLEGYGVEENARSAYYWLRMAEENSAAVRQRSRVLTEDLRNKIRPLEIEDLERQIANGAQKDGILAGESLDVFKQRLFSLTDRTAV